MIRTLSERSFDADLSVVHSTFSWSVRNIVELLHNTLPAAITGTTCTFGHVIGADRNGAEEREVRVRQLLTAAQVPAVLMRTCVVSVVRA